MWLDDNLVLCEETDFFGPAFAGNVIGDVIDLGQFDSGKPKLSGGSPAPDNIATQPNFGGVMPMTMMFRITESMVGGTSAAFRLSSSDAVSGDSIAGQDNLHWHSGIIPVAAALAGRQMIVPIPHDSAVPFRRYMQLIVDRVGTSTAGKISAMLLVGVHQWEALYANYVQV